MSIIKPTKLTKGLTGNSGLIKSVTGGGLPFGFAGVGSGSVEFSTTLNVSYPEGVVSGDSLFMFVSKDGSAVPTPPVGWDSLFTDTVGSFSHHVYTKEAVSADESTTDIDIALNSTEDAVGAIVLVPNGDISTITYREASTSGTTLVSRSLSAGEGFEGMLIMGWAAYDTIPLTFTTTPETAEGYTNEILVESRASGSGSVASLRLFSFIAPTTGIVYSASYQKSQSSAMNYGMLKIRENS